MKKTSFLSIILCLMASIAMAQTVAGPSRTETITIKPAGDGYEVQITFVYRFQLCSGEVKLDGYRSNHRALAYWYQGKRYTENEAGQFKTNRQDLYLNFDFTAEVWSTANNNAPIAKGKWAMVNLYNGFGGCYGDHGPGGMGLKDGNLVPLLYLRNIVAKDRPQRDSNIENRLRQNASAPQQSSQTQKSSSGSNYGSSSQSSGNSNISAQQRANNERALNQQRQTFWFTQKIENWQFVLRWSVGRWTKIFS